MRLIPLPPSEPKPFGWLIRFALDWLLPTLLAAWATYSLGYKFLMVARAADAADARAAAADTMAHAMESQSNQTDWITKSANVALESISMVNSQAFYWITLAVLVVGLFFWMCQHLQPSGYPYKWQRRKNIVLSVPAYWMLFGAVKLYGLIIAPLALAIAVARAIGDMELLAHLICLFIAAVLVTASFYHLMFRGLQPPFTFSISVQLGKGKPQQVSMDADAIRAKLEENADVLSKAAGGLWNCHVQVDQAGRKGVLSVGFLRADADWNAEEIEAFNTALGCIQSAWTTQGFQFKSSDYPKNPPNTKRRH
jgi:hypothetical protein